MSDEIQFPRDRRDAAERFDGVPPISDWPGPTILDAPADNASPVRKARHKARERRFEINRVALSLYVKERMTEQQVNAELHRRYKARLANGSVWRMYERAKRMNPATGRIMGFWVCVPNYRPSSPTSKARGPAKSCRNETHHLTQLFDEFPVIAARLTEFIVSRTYDMKLMRPVSKIDTGKVYSVFTSLCKAEGLDLVSPARWPFTTKRKGYNAVCRFYEQEKYRNLPNSAFNELNQETARVLKRDYAAAELLPLAIPREIAYARVELDEHLMDKRWIYLIEGEKEGEWIAVPRGRMYASVTIDCGSRAILSCAAVFNPSFRQEDTLRVVAHAIVPPPRAISSRLDDTEWKLPANALFPGEMPEFARNTWQVLAMDHAAAHRTFHVKKAIEAATGCEVSFDRTGEPTGRPHIENLIILLARFAEWSEAATGNSPDSASRRDPETGAIRSVVYVPASNELLQMACRLYNVTPQRVLDGDTPLERLTKMHAANACFVSKVGDFGYDNLHLLLPKYTAVLKRRHNATHGPICVYFKYSYYMGPELAVAQKLMAQADLTVDIYPQEDARFAFVVPRSAPDLIFFVVVRSRRWYSEPHTLEYRRAISIMATTKWFKAQSHLPQAGVGLARGLARALSGHKEFSQLLCGYFSFIDRYGNGEVAPIAVTHKQCDELLEYMRKTTKDSPPNDDDTVEDMVKEEAAAKSVLGSEPGDEETSDEDNPYGIF